MSRMTPTSFYFRHSTTPWVERLRFALRQAYFSGRSVSPLWSVLSTSRVPLSPQLVCKALEAPQRLFYDWRYGYPERVRALSEHYSFLMERLSDPVVVPLVNLEALTLAVLIGKSEQPYFLRLRVDHQMEKEGALTLELLSHDQPLLRLTWHLALQAQSWVIRIGGLQSTPVDTQNQIRQATKDFHGIQPRILMLHALRAIAQALRIEQIEAVAGAWHVYSSRRYRKPIASDYDQIWNFLGMHALPNGSFATDVQIPLKDLQDCPSHKRSEYRRRNEFLQHLQLQIGTSLGARV